MLVVLNGAQRSGKTTAANIMSLAGYEFINFSLPFKTCSHAIIGRDVQDSEKDTPLKELGGKSARDLYIDVANIGEKYDPVIWIKKAINGQYLSNPNKKYVLDSVGKQVQMDWLVECLGWQDIVLIKTSRPGCTWDDGRESVVVDNRVEVINVTNNGSLSNYTSFIKDLSSRLKVRI